MSKPSRKEFSFAFPTLSLAGKYASAAMKDYGNTRRTCECVHVIADKSDAQAIDRLAASYGGIEMLPRRS